MILECKTQWDADATRAHGFKITILCAHDVWFVCVGVWILDPRVRMVQDLMVCVSRVWRESVSLSGSTWI